MTDQRTAEKRLRLTKRPSISKAQYMQLMGLHAAYKAQYAVCMALEKAAYEITREIDRDGTPPNCGHTTDWLNDSRSLDEMLDLIGLKVRK